MNGLRFVYDGWNLIATLHLQLSTLYYGYRYYSASTGRWISRDPIGDRGGVALYGFAHNNPISVVDFFGLSFKIIPQQGDINA
jgi:RHS repeat-associated protein